MGCRVRRGKAKLGISADRVKDEVKGPGGCVPKTGGGGVVTLTEQSLSSGAEGKRGWLDGGRKR